MTNREFRKHLHENSLEAIRAEVLAEKNEKKKPPASEKGHQSSREEGRTPAAINGT
jgi:hypothetical protein